MIGQYPAETRADKCAFCGKLIVVGFVDGSICARCDLYTLYSDLYKDENGFRPHDDPTMSEMRTWIAEYDKRHQA